MGYNTALMLCNDNLSDYASDPVRFVSIIRDNLCGGDRWGITVLPTDHADATQLIAVGQNFATKLYTGYYVGSHHKVDGQVALLTQWADSLGYEIVPK